MRYTGVRICAALSLLGVTACAQAQARTAPRPSDDTERRVVRVERDRAQVERSRVRAQARAGDARRRAEVARVRAHSMDTTIRRRVAERDSVMRNRATLGVSLTSTHSRRDTLGIFVQSVVENGPAERAGIVEGDRIAAINGVDVRTQAADAGDPVLGNVAHRRFTRELQRLTPGTTATLRVWSGGRYREVPVTLGRYSEVYRNRRVTMIHGPGMLHGPGAVLAPRPPVPPRVMVAPRIHVAPTPPPPPPAPDAGSASNDFTIEFGGDFAFELPDIDGLIAGATAMIEPAFDVLHDVELELGEFDTLLGDVLDGASSDFELDVDADVDGEGTFYLRLDREELNRDTAETVRRANETMEMIRQDPTLAAAVAQASL